MKKKAIDVGANHGELQELELRMILPPSHQMRTKIEKDGIEELADSIKKLGVLQPILVLRRKEKFEIIVGHRRWLAARRAGLKTMPAIVVDDKAGHGDVMKLHENIVREDVNVVDEAQFLKDIMSRKRMTGKECAKMIGKSEGYVSQRMDLLRWDESVRNAVRDKVLSFSSARELARIEDDYTRKSYLQHAVAAGITPTVAKQWADDAKRMADEAKGLDRSGEPRVEGGDPGEFTFPCYVCGSEKKIDKTVMVRLCTDCREEIVK